MSWDAIIWARSVHCTGGPVARNVLHQLATYANLEGNAWPSQGRIAELTQYTVRAVRKALNALVAQGFIVRTRQFRKNGSKTVDCFHLVGWPPSNLAETLSTDEAEQGAWRATPGPAPGSGRGDAAPAACPGPAAGAEIVERRSGPGPAAGSKIAERRSGPESQIHYRTPHDAGARASARTYAGAPARAWTSLSEIGLQDPGWAFVIAVAREASIPDEAIPSVFERFRAHRSRLHWASAKWMPAWRSWCSHPARVSELAMRKRLLAKAAAIAAEPIVVNKGGAGGFVPRSHTGDLPPHRAAAAGYNLETPEMAELSARKTREYNDDRNEYYQNAFTSVSRTPGSIVEDRFELEPTQGTDHSESSGNSSNRQSATLLKRTLRRSLSPAEFCAIYANRNLLA